MWESVELRELRVFMALCEELHFGRTAERLRLSPSRVSQLVRRLELHVGAKLFDRNSRHVALTPLGEQLRDSVASGYRELQHGFENSLASANGIAGKLRVGMYSPTNAGPHMLDIVKTFAERHPDCEVIFAETSVARSQLDWLQSGDVDLLAMRLPFHADGTVVGPILSREPRVLAVAHDHPLATRESITYEEVADYPVSDVVSLPREPMNALIPARTPSGRPLRRIPQSSIAEAIMRIASGACVHPTVPSFQEYFRNLGTVIIPIRDMPPSETALVWLAARETPKLVAFVRAATDVLRGTRVGERTPASHESTSAR